MSLLLLYSLFRANDAINQKASKKNCIFFRRKIRHLILGLLLTAFVFTVKQQVFSFPRGGFVNQRTKQTLIDPPPRLVPSHPDHVIECTLSEDGDHNSGKQYTEQQATLIWAII